MTPRLHDPGSAGVCDICGRPLEPGKRRRLVWDSGPDGELVLADLCTRCAARGDRLLELYGGRGRDALRFTSEASVSAVARTGSRTVGGMIGRGLFYVLVGLVTFVLVTLVSSRV